MIFSNIILRLSQQEPVGTNGWPNIKESSRPLIYVTGKWLWLVLSLKFRDLAELYGNEVRTA